MRMKVRFATKGPLKLSDVIFQEVDKEGNYVYQITDVAWGEVDIE